MIIIQWETLIILAPKNRIVCILLNTKLYSGGFKLSYGRWLFLGNLCNVLTKRILQHGLQKITNPYTKYYKITKSTLKEIRFYYK